MLLKGNALQSPHIKVHRMSRHWGGKSKHLSCREIQSYRSTCRIVEQRSLLVPQITVHGNVVAGLVSTWPWHKTLRAALDPIERDRVGHVLTQLGIGNRALVSNPSVLLADAPSGEGWGEGDTSWACSMGKGNCTDFHSLFLAIIRAAGVPGQFEIGLAFPTGMNEGDITFFKCGYHCWTSFYTPEFGWVPADVSEAAQKPGLRDDFFGAVDENRVVLSRGRDIDLVPKQRGGPENFFTEPCIETATGKPLVYEKKLEFASV